MYNELNIMDCVICHYNEIALKGKNRKFFEEKLVENIKRVLNPAFYEFVRRISGRILIKLTEKGKKKEKETAFNLKKVFGIAYFVFAASSLQTIEGVKKTALEILKDKKFKTFKISAKRAEKKFSLNSQEINIEVGSFIVEKLNKKVKLEKPDITCFIEIVEKYAFLYLKKIKGPGGLPIGASGRAVALISGGIDSPVAAFEVMKRGVKIIFLHFHSFPYTNKASIEKVKELVKILSRYQGETKLYLIPFADIQKEILLNSPAELRVVLYRRMMLKIAQKIAEKERALAIVTGDSIGQVASQTLENIKAIGEAAALPVFRPLIGSDKEEIIKKAEKINTFQISILPHDDTCSRFCPAHPETKASLNEVKKIEEKLNMEKMINSAIAKSESEILI